MGGPHAAEGTDAQVLDEQRRLAALRSYGVLDTAAQAAFDEITRTVAERTGAQTALVTLVDSERQWFKSRHGFPDVRQTPRSMSFCDRTMREDDLLVVPDATRDGRFQDNPLVTGAPNIRFYAGAPLVASTGEPLGALCVIDYFPRALTPEQAEVLRKGAEQVMRELELRRSLQALTTQVTGVEGGAPYELLKDMLDRAPSAVWAQDEQGLVLWTNATFRGLAEQPPAEQGSTRLQDVLPLVVAARLDETHGSVLRTGEPATTEFTMEVDGAERILRATSFCLHDWRGEPYAVGSIAEDITEQRHSERQLRHLAERDVLTGLLNRDRFEQEVQAQVRRAARYGGTHAVLILDLDNFKQVNDSLGHKAGDAFLMSSAQALQDRLRDTDVLARLGGDEFGVLLPSVDAQEAQVVADQLVAGVRTNAPRIGPRPTRTTVSVGACVFGKGWETASDVIVCADAAMYEAKESGRDRAVVRRPANPAQAVGHLSRGSWSERIREALAEDLFVLYAQPIVGVGPDPTCDHELLLRMVDGSTVVSPDMFLPAADRYDLIQPIDRWVITAGLRVAAAAPGSFHINLSPKSMRDPGLVRLIERELQASGADPRHVVFEVTESAAVANLEQATTFAERLHDLGCRFALDDFGTGFSSFYYLKHLPLDCVKIDGDFVRELSHSKVDQIVVKSVVDIADELGCSTVGEYVEDERTLALLTRFGVQHMQGFHVGRPAPVEGLLALARG